MLIAVKEKERQEFLNKIEEEVVNGKHLPLFADRVGNGSFPVLGEGSHFARIMFVGEAPGKNEAASGRPFCGASGRILDELLSSAEINRTEVYITSIVKDRPPMNRDPRPDEVEAYAPYLDRQISIIRPEVIATLGRFSMAYIMNKFGLAGKLEPISKIHGKMFEAVSDYGKIRIIPLFHPAVAIYRGSKDELKKDFEILKQFK